ncbi:AraC family transcriptional regulator [Burkholderia cenocepacia]|uniref:AraC family transcriptional regulator n=1 Tax=Burkholderia cenocepacia TaxID=95486 RepID=UPI0023B8D648|nr:AraC family transcriptional regulator [Burkholderia cenocepacia]MDF0504643.1 AraC family transcriptional regulator [Burkholderia cenocepacia]
MSTLLLDELTKLVARHAAADGTAKPLPGLVLATAYAPTPLTAYVAEPVFSLVVQGSKRVLLGDRVFDYAAGEYLVVTVDLPVNGHITLADSEAPFLGIGITLKPDVIAALLLETGLARPTGAEPSGIAISQSTSDLLDPIVRLLRLLDRPGDIPVLAPAIEREILWRLINGPQSFMVRQLGLADSHLAQIGRAVRWIRTHYTDPFKVEDLASMVGMSTTSFHRHFLRITSFSPLRYQKQIRLQEARARLLATSDDVATVGFAVGYGSPSQFSREYRRMFGVPPGQESTSHRNREEG